MLCIECKIGENNNHDHARKTSDSQTVENILSEKTTLKSKIRAELVTCKIFVQHYYAIIREAPHTQISNKATIVQSLEMLTMFRCRNMLDHTS